MQITATLRALTRLQVETGRTFGLAQIFLKQAES
jgi:hypothetical protein